MNNAWKDKNILDVIKKGGIVVMPTDTIYGIVGSALNVHVVSRIYEIRKRAPTKPCIILIGDISELEKFSIELSDEQKKILQKYWLQGKTEEYSAISFVLDCKENSKNEKFTYLHRGTNTLAFRIPLQKELRDLFLQTGPLIAPSANLEGLPPAKNISEAKKYFGDLVDLYIDGGAIEGKASKIIKLHKDGSVDILRK